MALNYKKIRQARAGCAPVKQDIQLSVMIQQNRLTIYGYFR